MSLFQQRARDKKMNQKLSSVKVAVVQAAPVLFEREATGGKGLPADSRGGGAKAQLVLFPEAFIPAYPRGLSFGMVVAAALSKAAHLANGLGERRRHSQRHD